MKKKLTPARLARIAHEAANPKQAIDAAVTRALRALEKKNTIPHTDPSFPILTAFALHASAPTRFVTRIEIVQDALEGRGTGQGSFSIALIPGVSPYSLAVILRRNPSGQYRDVHTIEIIQYRDLFNGKVEFDFNTPIYRAFYKGHAANDLNNGLFQEWFTTVLIPTIKERLEF